MNRRRKKKPQPDVISDSVTQITQFDFQSKLLSAKSFWSNLPRFHRRAVPVIATIVLVLFLVPIPSIAPEPSEHPATERVAIELQAEPLSEQDSRTSSEEVSKSPWREYQVQDGDTLAAVFRNNGFEMNDLYALVRVEGNDKPLSRIKEGQLIRFKTANNGQLDIIQLERNGDSVMFFRLSDGGFGRSQ